MDRKNETKPDGTELKEIIDECLDSQGYVLFAAHIARTRDENGHNILQFRYKRYHFSLEDAKQAVTSFENFVKQELVELVESGRNARQ
jgi:hypothetical protein